MTKKKQTIPALPQGYFDIVPDDQKYWHLVWRKANNLLADYSFSRIDLAPVELAETFLRPIIAGDPDAARHLVATKHHGVTISLRAGIAASIMRSYLQYGMHVQPHPVKMFSSSPVVTSETSGDVMHWQLGVQTIGDTTEAVDAELLFLGCRILESLNIGTFTVRINTIGDAISRQMYIRVLRDFFRQQTKNISARVAAAAKDHPFRGLMLLAQEQPELAKDAPQAVDHLSDDARTFFKRLLEFLDEGQVPYVIDHTLLAADDSASHTLWQFVVDVQAEEGQSAPQQGLVVLHGGRMDRLSEMLGGAKTPAAGWVLEVDRIVERLKLSGAVVPDATARAKVFLSQLGDAAKKRSLMLFEEIRKAGIDVRYSLSRDTIKGQLRMAARFDVRFALIFGQKEALDGTVILREMETGIQETIPQEKIIEELKKRLRNK